MQTNTPAEALLVPLAAVPTLLGCSRAHVARMRVSGKFGPEVIRWGRKLLVRRSELLAWADSGLVDARTWEAMKSQRGRLKVS
jgi:hypothetical protein